MLVVIVGKSCSGKTTLTDQLAKKFNLKKIVTSTSRPRRLNEIDKVDYNFYSYVTMLKDIENGEYIESSCFNNWLYGTKKSDINIEENSIIVLNPQGYRELKKIYGEEVVGIYLNPPLFIRLKRILTRGDSLIEAFRRFWADQRDFKNLKDVVEIRTLYNIH